MREVALMARPDITRILTAIGEWWSMSAGGVGALLGIMFWFLLWPIFFVPLR